MLVTIGRRVILRHSGLSGTITELLDNQLVNVCLDIDGDIIPAFIDDLQPYAENANRNRTHDQSVSNTQAIQGSASEIPRGVLLAFVPMLRSDATPYAYQVFLINDLPSSILIEYQRVTQDTTTPAVTHNMQSYSALRTDEFNYDTLSEHIKIKLHAHLISKKGTHNGQQNTIRLKPKAFFKKVADAPILNKVVHLYEGLPPFKNTTGKPPRAKEDLKKYTKDNITHKRKSTHQPYVRVHEVEEFASFNSEIDLHIESLVDDPNGMTSKEILACQLQHFEQFLQKGYQLGIDKVFVIHGLGKGKLKQEISRRLQKMNKVKKFKNEYHPRYGYGATEVIFK